MKRFIMLVMIMLAMPIVMGALNNDDVTHYYSFDTDYTDGVGSINFVQSDDANISTATPKLGTGAAFFDDLGDYASTNGYLPDDVFETEYTLCAWVYPLSYYVFGDANMLFSGGVGGGTGRYYVGDTTVFKNGGTAPTYGAGHNTSSPVGYKLLCIADNGSQSDVFFNGVTYGTSGTTGVLRENQGVFRLGGLYDLNGQWYYGYIDELLIFNTSLSSADMVELYNGGAGLQYPFTIPPTPNGTGLINSSVSYWKSDTNGTYPDSVGSNDGIIDGATYITSGKINGAYNYNGIDNDIEMPNNSTLNTPSFSVGFWMKIDSSQVGMLVKKNTGGSGDWWRIFLNSGNRVEFDNFGDTISLTTDILSIDEWYYIVATFNAINNESRLYQNKVLKDNASGLVMNNVNTHDLIISRATTGGFNGTIDEVGFWNTALTQADINILYYNNTGIQYPFIPPDEWNFTNGLPAENTTYVSNKLPFQLNFTFDYYTNETEALCKLYYGGDNINNFTIYNDFYDSSQNFNYIINNELPFNSYTFGLNCSDASHNNELQEKSLYLYFDSIDPMIMIYEPSVNNDTILTTIIDTLDLNISIYDENLFNSTINIYYPNGSIYYNNNTFNNSEDWINLSKSFETDDLVAGEYTLQVIAADGHTKKDIDFDKWHIGKNNGVIDFGNCKVYTDQNENAITTYDYTCADDRCVWEYEFSKKVKGLEQYIECDSKITYLPDSEWVGHLISGDNWIDAENDLGLIPQVIKIDDYRYKYVYVGEFEKIKTKSIGELNRNEQNITFTIIYLYNYTESYYNNVIERYPDIFNLSLELSSDISSIYGVELDYDDTIYDADADGYDYNITFTAPTITSQTDVVEFHWNIYPILADDYFQLIGDANYSAGAWTNYNNIIDGDWDTYGYGNVGYAYLNYTKLWNYTGATWEVKDGNGWVNLTIPDTCLEQDTLQLRIWSGVSGGKIYYGCFNGTTYNNLRLSAPSINVYEQGIHWDYMINQSTTPINQTIYNYRIDDSEDALVGVIFPILNISIYDEITLDPINLSIGLGLTFDNGIFNTTKTKTYTNNHTITYLMYNYSSILPIDLDAYGTITLSGTYNNISYIPRVIQFPQISPLELSNYATYQLDLYAIGVENSTTITFNWKTSDYQDITGLMRIYRCQLNGSRILADSISVSGGIATANIELLTAQYSYDIIYNGEVYQQDSFYACHVESLTERTFYVDVSDIDMLPAINLYMVDCSLQNLGNDTYYMRWTTNPESSETLTGCLTGTKTTIIGIDEFYRNCTSSGLTLTRTIPAQTSDYYIRGLLYQGDTEAYCRNDILMAANRPAATQFGATLMFGIVFLIISVSLIYAGKSTESLVGAGLSIVIAFFLGLLAISWEWVATALSLIVIIALLIRYSRGEGGG